MEIKTIEINHNKLIIDIPEGMEIDLENSDLAKGIVKFKEKKLCFNDILNSLRKEPSYSTYGLVSACSKEELNPFDFTKIKTFRDALNALDYSGYDMQKIMEETESISYYSRASAAMIKLNIIRKALNLGQDLHLTKDPKDSCIYYCPYNPFVIESSSFYKSEIAYGKVEVIGRINSEGTLYNVLGGYVDDGGATGLGHFHPHIGAGFATADIGFLGCASEKIAKHLGKYFGMLITEAKYGDMVDFEIVQDKYHYC